MATELLLHSTIRRDGLITVHDLEEGVNKEALELVILSVAFPARLDFGFPLYQSLAERIGENEVFSLLPALYLTTRMHGLWCSI